MDSQTLDIIHSLPSCHTLFFDSPYKTGAQYIRVSTEEQTELSPVTQLKMGLEFAASHQIIIPREYVFIEHSGVSGRKAKNREAFNRMIAIANSREHLFDLILVWRFSRFARNQEESIVYKSLLKKNKIEVISITEPIEDNPFGKLNERIIEWMDEYYSIRLSDEVIRGMKENARRGVYQASPPLGYDAAGNKNPPLVNEQEKIIVQKIFADFLSGSTLPQIARSLNESGFRSKRGGLFEPRTLRYILMNPFYTGKIRWNYYDRSNCSCHEKEQIILAEGLHLPIIEEDVWEQVQQLLTVKGNNLRRKRDLVSCKHWLSGLLVCSCCHQSMTLSTVRNGKQTYSYFKCQNYAKGRCTQSNSLRAELAENCVLCGLKQILTALPPYKAAAPFTAHTQKAATFFQEMLKKLELKEERFKESYAAGVDTLKEYQENKKRLLEERMAIEDKIIALSNINRDTDYHSKEALVSSVYDILISKNQDYIKKGNALRSIVDSIVFNKESFTFRFYLSCSTGDRMEN